MMQVDHLKPLFTFVLAIFITTQILFVANVLILPKPAEALIPVGILYNIYDVLKDIGIAAAKRVALSVVDGFLTRFMDKVVQKYRIRNYVYYDQVLTDYYLTNYIRDKVSDPDLQNIFLLLDSAYVAGNNTGYTGYDPSAAIIPKLKKKINDMYLARGGISTDVVENNPNNLSNEDYFNAGYLWAANPPSGFASNVYSQYAGFQSSSSTAAQLEVIVGGGYKSGRFLGGSCTIPSSGGNPSVTDPASDPTTCANAGGTWNPSAADYARSFIDNPGQFAHDFVNTAIDTLVGSNFDPNNIWSAIGSLLGQFLYNKLALNSGSGVLNEGGEAYTTANAPTAPKSIDIDGDGIIDAYDINGDGILDAGDMCAIGGIAPNCTTSSAATTPPAPDCTSDPTSMACTSPNNVDVVTRVKNYLVSIGTNLSGDCGAFEITRRVAWALRDQQAGLIAKGGTNCNGFSTDKIAYPDKSFVDILGDSGGANTPTWLPGPPNPDIVWTAPTDPGDPAGSY